MRSGVKMTAADLGGFGHKRAVNGIGGPASPKLVVCREVVGRIAERVARGMRHEDDLLLLAVKHGGNSAGGSPLVVMEHVVSEGLRFGLVVEDSLAITPSGRGKKERHNEPFLTVRGRARVDLSA